MSVAIVDLEPGEVDMVKARGRHEVGCHGYSHEQERWFDVMSSIILSPTPWEALLTEHR